LPPDVRTKDIEDLFYKYGKIKYIDLKNRRGPPFAFVEFDDPLDADDAIEGRDGYNFDGYKLRVEIQKGPRNPGMPRPNRSGPPTRRSDYRCIITNLPPTGSWQDLKDHMREAGNVCYADVFKDGTGVVEFIRYDDMKYAVKHLDDTKFRSHEVSIFCFIFPQFAFIVFLLSHMCSVDCVFFLETLDNFFCAQKMELILMLFLLFRFNFFRFV
jgi:arginine/serine-rich splicing factor 1/9